MKNAAFFSLDASFDIAIFARVLRGKVVAGFAKARDCAPQFISDEETEEAVLGSLPRLHVFFVENRSQLQATLWSMGRAPPLPDRRFFCFFIDNIGAHYCCDKVNNAMGRRFSSLVNSLRPVLRSHAAVLFAAKPGGATGGGGGGGGGGDDFMFLCSDWKRLVRFRVAVRRGWFSGGHTDGRGTDTSSVELAAGENTTKGLMQLVYPYENQAAGHCFVDPFSFVIAEYGMVV